MTFKQKNGWTTSALLCGVAVAAFAFVSAPDMSYAQSGNSGAGSEKGSGHSGSAGKKSQKGKSGASHGSGGGGKSLRDVFSDLDEDEDTTAAESEDHGSGKKSGQSADKKQAKGKKSGSASDHSDTADASEEEDSDRPDWAGTPGKEGKPGNPNQSAGTKKGDLFGDLYVLDRDDNGVPSYIQLADGTWVVQPIDADGNLIPLDEDGHPLDPSLAVEVELGRLNVGRAPLNILVRRYDEVLTVLNLADEVSLDASGRIVYTIDGVSKTIDSPLENLAIFVELMNTGTLNDITDEQAELFTGDLANLVDGEFTTADFVEAASFLAAASDKTGMITKDEVIYIAAFLGIEGTLLPDENGIGVDATFIDYSDFTYVRSDFYDDVMVTVLMEQDDGSWVPTPVDVYTAVFADVDYDGANVDAFTQAADDARAVIEFLHEYEVPASQ